MIVVGGLTSEDLLCDQPGVYIYNTTSEWTVALVEAEDFVD